MNDDKRNASNESAGSYGGYQGYGSYGNYGGYYYGYGYNHGGYGGSDQGPSRSFKDYLVILRERIWYLVVTFFIIFTATLLYTFNVTPEFSSTATIQVLRDDPNIFGDGVDVMDNTIRGMEDFQTQMGILGSGVLISSVAERIKDEDRQLFMAPYKDQFSLSGPMSLEEVLQKYRTISPVRMTWIAAVSYLHPDPNIAAKVANYFADEYINYNVKLNIETSMRAVEDLRIRADHQREKVEEIRENINEYRKKYKRLGFDTESNAGFEGQELNSLKQASLEDERILAIAERNWRLVQDYMSEDRPLWDIPFIAEMPRISDLLTQRSQQNITVASLRKRYRAKHPSMIEAERAVEETEIELKKALDSAVEKTRISYEQVKRTFEQTSSRLAEKELDMMNLGEIAVKFNSMQDELEVNNALYQAMMGRLQTEMAQVALTGPSARIIDPAGPSNKQAKPDIVMNLALGVFGGLFAGAGLVFLIAILDDRIKSAYDIENAVGLPLIGIIPRIKRLNSPEKAQAVASNAERRVTEAFRAIHSALKLNEASKKAKIIITTSTSPSEGKSFVSTNLAITFAIHGERTLILDGDLRMPNVAKSLNIEERTDGVVKYFAGGCTLEQAILTELYPNLDVLPAGQKAKNPTQILNSPDFEQLLATLSERYDRIFIDTPPIAVVSDVLTVLPFADGIIYVIKFNAVKRKTAKSNLRRIIESNTPVFGAILNQISVSVASYYYANYYDKSYASYYGHDEDGDSIDVPIKTRRSKTEDKALPKT
ncbi:GumC family protein [Cerasicoccus arenae]|uniref:non-specific protein-tyrosine kinase n=1 Tax=Cerasicoccus arenae TaxID=424488 RepID=A0A8J3DAM6_9BACT|nr:polysaccharide biosynthesis tyrosine autokinase [Cerasicoccus arenae]MBK1857983.1 polysaccharide biosynthesis tyrosine autokinase [Cerasicoccus arenae]GHB97667.1 protein-tyrosine kinase [Cerasicoccus arenae]